MALIGLVVWAWSSVAAWAPATRGAQTTADEPQYLLTAQSLGTDLDLDISNQLAEGQYRSYHEVALDEQTFELDRSGTQISPHDPLLPLLLALPMRLGGWVLAKLTLAAFAGATAAVAAWTAVHRFGVRRATAAAAVLVFFLTAPLTTYGTQIYPEMPAALAVLLAVAAVTARPSSASVSVMVAALVCLPWLSLKYTPLAATIGLIGLMTLARGGNRRLIATYLLALATMAVVYAVTHRAIYGSWTAYATGDHFVSQGELSVVGTDPDFAGRSVRLVALLVDRTFGLAAWAPAWLLITPAIGGLVRRRPSNWATLLVPALVGWLTATYLALTMNGWWWPGRQLVVVLPLLVIAVAWWADSRPAVTPLMLALGAIGVVSWSWVLVEAYLGQLTLIVDFWETGNPLFAAWRLLLPAHFEPNHLTGLLIGVWSALLVGAAIWGYATQPLPISPQGASARTVRARP